MPTPNGAPCEDVGKIQLNLGAYKILRSGVIARGYKDEYEWAQNVKAPKDALEFFCEYSWVVLNSGMKNTIARKIWDRIQDAIAKKKTVSSVFGHVGKAKAIQEAWDKREERFRLYQISDDLVLFCESLPWVGQITKWHLAKNLGADVAKPDRWLIRVAEATGETVQGLCARIAKESGDRIATVDLVLWRACSIGLLHPEHIAKITVPNKEEKP